MPSLCHASRFASRIVIAIGVLGCTTRAATPAAPAPAYASLSVELAPPRDLTISRADGSTVRVAQAQKLLGRAQHHDADSLVLAVSAVYTAEGWEHFTDATVRLAPGPTQGISVLNTRTAATNTLGALALPAIVALMVLFVAAVNSGPGT